MVYTVTTEPERAKRTSEQPESKGTKIVVKLNTFKQDNSSCNRTLTEPTRMTASCASTVGCKAVVVPCTAASTYLSLLTSNGLGMKNYDVERIAPLLLSFQEQASPYLPISKRQLSYF